MPPATAQPGRVSGAREQHLQASALLIRGPAADERGGREAHHDEAHLHEHELQEPARRGQVDTREDRPDDVREGRELGDEVVPEAAADRGQHEPEDPDAEAPAERQRQLVAEGAPDRTTQAEGRARQARASGSPVMTPRSRRAKSSTPAASRATATSATSSQRGPVVLCRQRDVVVGPGEPGEVGDGPELRHVGRVVADHEGQQHDHAGHAGSARPAHDRGQREGQGTRDQAEQADPQREADRRERGDLVAQGRGRRRPSRPPTSRGPGRPSRVRRR